MYHQESNIQRICVQVFRLLYPSLVRNLISIPNGAKLTTTQARVIKAEGLIAGASDLFLFVPAGKYHGLAIEMKTPRGRQQPSQKLWQRAIEGQGYKYVICRSVDDFRRQLKVYLSETLVKTE